MKKILIVGGGKEGYSLLKSLSQIKTVHVTGLLDTTQGSPGVQLAKKLGVEVFTDLEAALKDKDEVVIDTGDCPELSRELRSFESAGTEIIGPRSYRLLHKVLEELDQRRAVRKIRNDMLKLLAEENTLSAKLQKVMKPVLQLTEAETGAIYLIDPSSKPQCWLNHSCQNTGCPAYNNTDKDCWNTCSLGKGVADCSSCSLVYNIWLKPISSFDRHHRNLVFLPLQVKEYRLKDLLFGLEPVLHENLHRQPYRLESGSEAAAAKTELFFPLSASGCFKGFLYLSVNKKAPSFYEDKLDLLQNIAHDLSFALDTEAVKAELQERLLQLEVLRQVGNSLISENNIEQLYSSIVKSALLLTNAHAGSLAIFDAMTDSFELVSSMGFSPGFTKELGWKRRDRGLTSAILSSTEPLVISDASNHPDFDNPLFQKEGIQSLVAVPLRSRGEIIGILYVDDFKPRAFSPIETDSISLLSTQAAVAIQKAQTLKSSREMAIRDGMTGLYNYRYFNERVDEELERARRYDHTISIIMCDIDYFKEYNDLFGHLSGDEALRKVAAVLSSCTREFDFVARYGGEEFVLMLPETSLSDAELVAGRIRSEIEKTNFSPGDEADFARLTMSFGIADFPSCATGKYELINRADVALYVAKNRGRNQVRLYDESLKNTRIPGKAAGEKQV